MSYDLVLLVPISFGIWNLFRFCKERFAEAKQILLNEANSGNVARIDWEGKTQKHVVQVLKPITSKSLTWDNITQTRVFDGNFEKKEETHELDTIQRLSGAYRKIV